MVQVDSYCHMETLLGIISIIEAYVFCSFKNLRFDLFYSRVRWEIYYCISPHLHHDGDYGYPFNNNQELENICATSGVSSLPFAQEMEPKILKMPDFLGRSFRYILYRELDANSNMSQRRMNMYRGFADRNDR